MENIYTYIYIYIYIHIYIYTYIYNHFTSWLYPQIVCFVTRHIIHQKLSLKKCKPIWLYFISFRTQKLRKIFVCSFVCVCVVVVFFFFFFFFQINSVREMRRASLVCAAVYPRSESAGRVFWPWALPMITQWPPKIVFWASILWNHALWWTKWSNGLPWWLRGKESTC